MEQNYTEVLKKSFAILVLAWDFFFFFLLKKKKIQTLISYWLQSDFNEILSDQSKSRKMLNGKIA